MARHQSGNKQTIKWDAKRVLDTHANQVHAASKAVRLHPRNSCIYAPHSMLKVTGHAVLNVAKFFVTDYHADWHAYRQHARLAVCIVSITDMA